MSTRIIIADDHLLFAEGLDTILKTEPGMEILEIVAGGEELMRTLSRSEADLVLLDLSMPGMDGMEAAAKITSLHPGVKMLVITMREEVETIRELMKLGVHGILPKNTGRTELLLAISEIMKGNTYFSQRITRQLANHYQRRKQEEWQLTKREKEVLQLIYEGLTTAGIAEKLFISSYTVETHRKNLFVKSGLNKSAQLVKKAQELGYIKITN